MISCLNLLEQVFHWAVIGVNKQFGQLHSQKFELAEIAIHTKKQKVVQVAKHIQFIGYLVFYLLRKASDFSVKYGLYKYLKLPEIQN